MYTEALTYFDDHAFYHGTDTRREDMSHSTCLWLALAHGAGVRAGTPEGNRARDDIAGVLGFALSDILKQIYEWNDTHSRDEVRDVLQILAMRESYARAT